MTGRTISPAPSSSQSGQGKTVKQPSQHACSPTASALSAPSQNDGTERALSCGNYRSTLHRPVHRTPMPCAARCIRHRTASHFPSLPSRHPSDLLFWNKGKVAKTSTHVIERYHPEAPDATSGLYLRSPKRGKQPGINKQESGLHHSASRFPVRQCGNITSHRRWPFGIPATRLPHHSLACCPAHASWQHPTTRCPVRLPSG